MLYVYNVSKWSHSKSQVRKALDEADDKVGFNVVDSSSQGHSWGYVLCEGCGQKLFVWSTPRSADNHANQIRRFLANHRCPKKDAAQAGELEG